MRCRGIHPSHLAAMTCTDHMALTDHRDKPVHDVAPHTVYHPPTVSDLPIADALPALHTALNAGRNAVLVAPPGAGKTTLVPLALLSAPWRGDGRILMLEPRRLATRAAAVAWVR
jgi:ATP-dependent helicase HrpB